MDAILESPTERFNAQIEEEEEVSTVLNERKYEWGYLRKKCQNLELEQFYKTYMQRLRVSYLSLFFTMHMIVVGLHCVLLFSSVMDTSAILMDAAAYIAASFFMWIVLSLNYRTNLIQRRPWISYATSWLSIVAATTADLGIVIYHAYKNSDILRPTYGYYLLYAVYIFMPIPENVHAFVLGVAVTISYLTCFMFITFRKYEIGDISFDVKKFLSETIFMVCLNLLGIYYRLMKEIAVRTTFLDKRQCVEENLLLRYARDQEKNLLLSIIPAKIANRIEQDVKVRIEHLKLQNRTKVPGETRKLFIEPHNDVTVLYADVVNYTHLTTTLDVKTLVDVLHELFVKFDTASEEFNVLRIKFLGDCYYCVSGVPVPNDLHAKCCVDLGLRMIKDIRDVRNKRKLNIDMRIGVHSGNILSGVIGACKWQFDIWSKDVDIANRLESTGQSGRVHVSEHTLKLLDGEYMYEEGTMQARNDEVLRKYHIRTFLIRPPKSGSQSSLSSRSSVLGVQRQIEQKQSYHKDKSTNFMQNTIVQYNQIRSQAKLEMSRELDKMPIGRIQFRRIFGRSERLTQDEIEEQSFRSNITSLCLFFKNWRWEMAFMNEVDIMLKYSIFFGLIVFFAVMSMQAVNEPQTWTFWNLTIFGSIIIIICFSLTWYKKVWLMYFSKGDSLMPTSNPSKCLYNLSDTIQKKIIARVSIYLSMVLLNCTCTLLQLLDCNRIDIEHEEIDIQLFYDGKRENLCFDPWAVTESIALTLCMSFLFTRVPFALKLILGLVVVTVYSALILFESDLIYEKSATTNVGLYAEYAHLLLLMVTLAIFHLMDRQTEFITKVDYNWKRQLQKKQDDAKVTNETIKILINNILPSHVADIYMTKRMKNELYYEEYDNVAVMFATIRNYDTEKVGLRVLNEIICDFDEVLNSDWGMLKIEKIKVAGWTYMAACGLDVERSDHVNSQRNSSLLPNGRRSHYNTRGDVVDYQPSTSNEQILSPQYEGHRPGERQRFTNPNQMNVVYVMAQFALELMRAMHSFNLENLQVEDGEQDRGMLRIGISNGEIMAGVVGSYKPHYDIWGNAVNMASRMDSTGIPGYIQVTQETATVLTTFDIKCTYRGQTYVKGRGEIPTYFIEIDDDLNFIHSKSDQAHSEKKRNIVGFRSRHNLDADSEE